MLLKSVAVKNVWFVTTTFLIMDLNFQILFVMFPRDLTMLCVKITENAIITVKSADYHCISHGINKYKAINLLKKSVLKIMGIYENACARSNLRLL